MNLILSLSSCKGSSDVSATQVELVMQICGAESFEGYCISKRFIPNLSEDPLQDDSRTGG